MNINNIAIVRATNIIPFDGVYKPISKSMYLKKDINTEFARRMNEFLKEEGIFPPIDYSQMTDEYMKEYSEKKNEILRQFIPYVSDYNSVVLFSLNGLVPDDSEIGFGNNTFSNKKCVIIDGLKEHIDDVISLMPTDTAIKGEVVLSESAIILIEKDTYEQLSEKEKQQLNLLSLRVKTFTENLKEEVYNTLKETNRFIPETLSLSRSDNGFRYSVTSDEQKRVINNIAKEYEIPQVLFFNLLTSNHDYNEKLEDMKLELENRDIVIDYYMENFFRQLLSLKENNLLDYIPNYMNNNFFLNELMEYIKDIGIKIERAFGYYRIRQSCRGFLGRRSWVRARFVQRFGIGGRGQ